MSYADDLDNFACALATLIGRDEESHRADRTPPEIALAARDIALTRLRVMCGLITGTGPTLENFLARDITTDPAGALYSALADLPLLSERNPPLLVDILTVPSRPGQKEWQELARAALFLEPYSDALPDLPGPFAWKVIGDIGNLATAVPCLDDDLHRHRAGPVVDAGRHGALRIAAAQLESVRRALGGDLVVSRSSRLVVRPVRTINDLPTANADLAALLRRRSAEISAPEIRAAARVLVEGLDLAARVHSTGGNGAPCDPAVSPVASTAGHLKQLLHTPLATLNDVSPDSTLRVLGGDISRQFRILHRLCDQLDDLADPRSRLEGHAKLRGGLDGWVRDVPAVVAALDHALTAAHRDRRLLGRPSDSGPADARHWHPVVPGASPEVVRAVRRAREDLRDLGAYIDAADRPERVTSVLAEHVRTRRASEEPLPVHPNQRTERRRSAEENRRRSRTRLRRPPGDITPGPIRR
ncbi:hypothetical protein [Sporichthya polymorpha]|uniref:hypothetical protein n=1 Tax=Sporichthya polymorpha TaxID=35751 RepID=UPI0012EB8F23|nr:hypothetical protein [Sporichthya polymorpha]